MRPGWEREKARQTRATMSDSRTLREKKQRKWRYIVRGLDVEAESVKLRKSAASALARRLSGVGSEPAQSRASFPSSINNSTSWKHHMVKRKRGPIGM